MMMNSYLQIDLQALRDNVETLRKELGPDVKLIPVIKGDAYGLGAVRLAQALNEMGGIDTFAVSQVAEGIALRQAGIKTFVYTNQSTAFMSNLHDFAANGCTMQGLCTIIRQENRYGEDEAYEVQGIRFSLTYNQADSPTTTEPPGSVCRSRQLSPDYHIYHEQRLLFRFRVNMYTS